jgi:hypothetical protein
MAAPITAGRVFSYQMQGQIGVVPQLYVQYIISMHPVHHYGSLPYLNIQR